MGKEARPLGPLDYDEMELIHQEIMKRTRDDDPDIASVEPSIELSVITTVKCLDCGLIRFYSSVYQAWAWSTGHGDLCASRVDPEVEPEPECAV